MNKEYRYLSTYNRYRILGLVKAKLRELGAKILLGPFDKEMEIEVMTNENDIDKVKKLKASCPNIIVNSSYLNLRFIYDNYYYHLTWNDNPFFPNRVSKIKINDDYTYIGDRYIEEYDKLNDFGDIFGIMTEDMLNDNANNFFKTLLVYMANVNESRVVSNKKRVYDYGGSYHYEIIYDTNKHYVLLNKELSEYNRNNEACKFEED